MSTVNYHTSRSSNLAAFNAIVLNVSTLTGSTIQTTATATTSSIVVSTLTTRSATYSTLTGSTITTSSIITPVIATATGFTTIGQNTNFPNRSIEIGSDAANSVYFDFHSSDSVYADYSTRIQSLGGSTIGQGHMSLQASTINILGTSGVGIGTSAPGYKLDVLGDVNFGSNDATNGSRIRLLGTNACIQGGPSGSDLIHLVSGNGTKALSVAYSGSVGIGTTNPTGKCHIYGNGQSTGLSDVYSLNISSPDSFNGNGGITVYSESINLKAGDLTWSSNTIRVYGARIYIGGGYSINGAQNQGNIIMYTGNAERVRVSESGNVGIGTSTPLTTLTIQANTSATGVGTSAYCGIHMIGGNNADYFNGITWSGNNSGNTYTHAGILVQGSGSYGTKMRFYTTNSWVAGQSERMVIDHNGNVGIGVSNPSYLLHVGSISNVYNLAGYLGSGGYGNYGNNSITNATSLYISGWGMTAAAWGVTSDRRIKTNIEPVSNILSIINQINVVKYDYIDPRLGREECSVIAQELQEVFPNAINISTDYLPNIMKLCTYTRQDTIITLSVPLQSTPDNLNDIKVGSILKLLISNEDQKEKEITTPILSISFIDHTIQVSSWVDYSDTYTVIVYGTQVDNYLSIDKPQLGVMALQGVKELVKQNADLQAIIDTQAAQIAIILARLNAAGIA